MSNLRKWATPLTIGSFIISAVTGIFLFFHVFIGLVKPAHEWLSWFMVLGVFLHVFANWRAFGNYFRQRMPLAVIGLFGVLTVASMLPLGNMMGGEGGEGNPRAMAMKSVRFVESASLSQIASIAQTPAASLIEQLQAQGIQVSDPEQSIAKLATSNNVSTARVLSVVLK